MVVDRLGPDPLTLGMGANWSHRPINLASAVASELVQRIVAGLHEPGSALPAEPALCTAFSVSRPVIREAMKMLQERGLVSIRQGAGTVVTPPETWHMLDESVLRASIERDDGLDTLDDVVVTRRLLEVDMAYVASLVATPEAIDAMRVLVDVMDAAIDDHDAYIAPDIAFHDLIMRTSRNRIARAVVHALAEQVHGSPRYRGRSERELRIASNAGHRRVLDAISNRDAAAARSEMYAHITDAWLVRRGGSPDPERLRRN